MLWKRLRSRKPSKRLTRDQVSRYLETFMKQHYQKVRKEGALTFDKVQNYLNYLAKIASGSLCNTSMDQNKVAGYSEKIKPVIEDVGTKAAITEEDVQKHSKEIRNQAQLHVEQMSPTVGEQEINISENGKEPDKKASQLPVLDDSKSNRPGVSTEKDTKARPDDHSQGNPLFQEVVPIGFEEGAPKVSLETFFSFPLAARDTVPESDKRFDMHLKYLDLAVKQSCLESEALEVARTKVKDLPEKRYSKYFDIFPENEYDDAQLMIIFSQWRNQTLNRFLIEDEGQS